MNFQNLLFSKSTSSNTNTIMNNSIESKEEDFNYINDLPDKEEEEELSENLFNRVSQIQSNEEENILKKMNKRRRYKVIKHLKRRLDKEIKRLFLRQKTFKVKKSFVKMDEKDFYDKYVLKDLSVKETFAGFSKTNRWIFRKLSKKEKYAELEVLISTKISSFFR